MTDPLALHLQPSKIYLILTLSVYLLSLFCAWYWFYAVGLSVAISASLSAWLYYFLPKTVRLTHPDSIVKIVLDKTTLNTTKKNGTTQQYPWFYPTYQSRFLVIIETKKEAVVIFKDAIEPPSLSMLNRFINAHT